MVERDGEGGAGLLLGGEDEPGQEEVVGDENGDVDGPRSGGDDGSGEISEEEWRQKKAAMSGPSRFKNNY